MSEASRLRGGEEAKRILEWRKMHVLQGREAPAWRMDEETARSVHEWRRAQEYELDGFRREIEAASGRPARAGASKLGTWKDLHGSRFYGVDIEIVPTTVEGMVRAHDAEIEYAAVMRGARSGRWAS